MTTKLLPQLSVVAAWICVATVTGCASKPLTLTKSLPWTTEKSYETPEKIIAVWTDAVYQMPGAPPTRGFGGRLYFYNRSGDVVPVDGELIVYAFDEGDPGATPDRPSRKYAFTAEQLTRYYSESELGASYNIWIPWDAVGGDEKQIALFPVFADKSGKVVRGMFADNRLPGRRELSDEERRGFYMSHKRRAGDQTKVVRETGVRPASFDAPATEGVGEDKSGNSGLVSHTIRVPRSLAERMAASQSQVAAPAGVPVPGPVARLSSAPAAPLPSSSGAIQPGTAAPAAPVDHRTAPTSDPRPPASSSVPSSALPAAAPAAGTVLPAPPNLGQQGFMGADPQYSVSARSHAWARQDARSARFEPPQFRVPAAPGARPRLGRVSTQLSP
ncbi:MAG: hypothetical protein MUF48_00735 [Pirellulaceae bacterium]|nr:hypothetical protein [Pirellulaceae bacterium]